ncbi:unnamed protein product, partial [Trichogramma brassicae]
SNKYKVRDHRFVKHNHKSFNEKKDFMETQMNIKLHRTCTSTDMLGENIPPDSIKKTYARSYVRSYARSYSNLRARSFSPVVGPAVTIHVLRKCTQPWCRKLNRYSLNITTGGQKHDLPKKTQKKKKHLTCKV